MINGGEMTEKRNNDFLPISMIKYTLGAAVLRAVKLP